MSIMAGEGVIVGEPTSGSAPPSAPGSPKARIKFLCSHGGKILPRPPDGHLKYVGGETRIISVLRDISFQELMKKLAYQIDGEMALKYQLVPEDIDTLVSVKSDEDLKHMFEEHDRYERAGGPRLRTFLFPVNPVVVDSGSMEPHPPEQRYIDAINGVVRAQPTGLKRHPTVNVNQGSLGFSSFSACSSPRSPESCTTDTVNHENLLPSSNQIGRSRIHKVWSSPSLCSLDAQQQGSPNNHQYSNLSHQHYRQSLHHGYQHTKPPIDHHKCSGAPERLVSVRSVSRVEGVKYQVDHLPQYYYPLARHNRGSGIYQKCIQYDEYSAYVDRRPDRTGSVPMSPAPLSPRHGHVSPKGWDTPIAVDY